MSAQTETARPPWLSNFLRRAIVAVVGIAALMGLGYLGGWPFFIVVAGLAITALSEYYSALQAKGMRPNVCLGWLCTLMILYATQQTAFVRELSGLTSTETLTGVNVEAEADTLQIILFILLFCVGGTMVAQFKNRPGQSAVANTATTVFGVVYIGILLSFVLRIRYVDVPGLTDFEGANAFTHRMGGLLFAIVPVWMCDTMAFVAGHLWGRIKLAPFVSPNKTVEGSIGGFLGAILGAVLLAWWLHIPILHAVFVGAVLGSVGQLGDLGKSVLKRDIGIKDFGSAFGPHGGVLDRFDAVLFCMPLAFWYIWFMLMR